MKAKIKSLKTTLVGKTVPDSACGHAGRAVEDILIQDRFQLDRKGTVDIPGLDVEVKSRDVDATSAQTVGRMSLAEIKVTDYASSNVWKKIQTQFRVKIKDNVIVSAEIVDFSWNIIQDKLEKSYEAARLKIINGDKANYIRGGRFGIFERSNKDAKLGLPYQFRLADGAMKQLERMAGSTARKLFTF